MLNKGYSYIDNWYSSPYLFHRLFSAGTNSNRKNMPKELAKEKLKIGEAVAYSSNNITAMKWTDRREVCMLSTKHTLDFAETGKVYRKMQTKIMKRTAVIDYNMKMRGVDVGDQILSKFHVMQDVVKRRSATPGDLPSRLSGQHFPEKFAPSAANRGKIRKTLCCVLRKEEKERINLESCWTIRPVNKDITVVSAWLRLKTLTDGLKAHSTYSGNRFQLPYHICWVRFWKNLGFKRESLTFHFTHSPSLSGSRSITLIMQHDVHEAASQFTCLPKESGCLLREEEGVCVPIFLRL
ncbi:hypothetical protein PR048_031280 [Dryococelus australis]|uniref:PiggyBac transposable element-derived protein domain-containing protein n=1 Tax=Dryococelus australis TaxID=614101 RepID=A0ABQ9G7X6_9NEOP|nr:hypothetical protein PR048_031280 [Dryococelus australis]